MENYDHARAPGCGSFDEIFFKDLWINLTGVMLIVIFEFSRSIRFLERYPHQGNHRRFKR